jgi:hypothetical protein
LIAKIKSNWGVLAAITEWNCKVISDKIFFREVETNGEKRNINNFAVHPQCFLAVFPGELQSRS